MHPADKPHLADGLMLVHHPGRLTVPCIITWPKAFKLQVESIQLGICNCHIIYRQVLLHSTSIIHTA